MSEELKPLRGEIMPQSAALPAAPGTPPPQVGGPAFWVRWRYQSARDKAEAYTAFLRSLDETVKTTEQLERSIERRDAGLARLERLGDLREAEHLKIDGEVESARAGLAAQRLTARTTLAELEADAVQAERRLARLKAEPVPNEDRETASPARRAADLIKKLRHEHAEIIKELRAERGADWSQADEDMVERMELALNDRVNRIIEEMRDA